MIREKILDIFDENGIVVLQGEENIALEIDSIQFVSIVVQIENEFDIEIPEEFLMMDILSSFNDFVHLIEKITSC